MAIKANPKIIYTTKPDMDKIPGGWETDFVTDLKDSYFYYDKSNIETPFGRVHLFKNLFNEDECNELVKLFMQSPNFEGVSIQGRKDIPDDRIGSIRTTVWNPKLAEKIWDFKFENTIMPSIACADSTATDWWQGDKNRKIWYSMGISPIFRFMKYKKEGQHYAHYDAGYIYPDDNYRTLYSFVLYLTTNENGGGTRFIEDNQDNLKAWERNHEDWTREAREDEVLFTSKPIKGNVLIFPHRMCHDVEKYLGDTPRIIIRGDILFTSYYR